MKLLMGLLAVGSWIASALLADAKVITPPFFLLFSALGWFFLVIAIGGKKGAAVGVGVLLFAVCIVGILVKMPRNFLPYTTLKPGSFFFWCGVLASAGFALLIPSIVIVKLWKRFGKEQKVPEDKGKKKEEKEKEKTHDKKAYSSTWKRSF